MSGDRSPDRSNTSRGEDPPGRSNIRKMHDLAAGIDVGAEEHWVCVDPAVTEQPIRRFGAFTDDLRSLVGWLRGLGITTVAMEATGVYWRELYVALEEAGMEVLLADPRQTRNPSGRKTDMQDCRWIWELHAHGLLSGAFVPEPLVQQLRTYLRYRQTQVTAAGVALVEMQRALSLMNIKLQHVISDIGGETGMAIINAIVSGVRDPQALAQLRNYRCKQSEQIIAKALTGTWRPEHLFLLRQAHEAHGFHRAAIARCDQEIDALIQRIPPQHPLDEDVTPKRATGKNDFGFDAQRAAYRLSGIDMAGIDGIGPNTALQLLGEIGFDLSPWPSPKAFCCWLGLCPNPKRSGGKRIGRMPTSANRAATILRNAAMGLDGKQSELSRFFRRHAARKGRAEAIKATAHKLARIIYALFRDRSRFDPAKLIPQWTQRAKDRMAQRLEQLAQRIGYTLKPAAAEGC